MHIVKHLSNGYFPVHVALINAEGEGKSPVNGKAVSGGVPIPGSNDTTGRQGVADMLIVTPRLSLTGVKPLDFGQLRPKRVILMPE
ncbi:hypothetical protein PSE10C_54280 [Pseudomonas amygdali pv. eriobotryae]|uniref:Uncharacterized protein n=1 Tax=Pseudomonas amygdali pv. eriobotryae TaxID=129137 RepID=A0A9P3AL53_PSEA0|nr:hypothetical protein PSE10A_58520 [Pseudomonas amygdali pv. eriobotryae]GFZ74686.1 hypothetical protein PSE10C_54280 [Pseudomonas amygdali pv. eriobotryae]